MTEKRIQFNNIIQNQLPAYVREEFPLVAEFLKQYYISQEFQGAPTDLVQNIDQYLKLDNIKTNAEYTTLTEDVSFLDETIIVSSTIGFPDSYGLLQIDDEIITYTSKTATSFTGCVRGFSGVSSYKNQNKPDELVFTSTSASDHSKENSDQTDKKVINLSSLFLTEFFNKIKYQITPGFENREFYSGLDKYLFLKQSKDFYSTRGTETSFKILFKVLYGEDVKVIKPRDFLINPSDSLYTITNDLVVEKIEGNPYELRNSTLFQDEYGTITKGYAPISNVEKILSQEGREYYKLSFDAGYNRDLIVDGSLYGNFSIHPKTKLIGQVSSGSKTLDVDSTIGFPSSGQLSVTYSNGTSGVISYTSKNINQFFGCSGVTATISDNSDIYLNTYARNEDNSIKVRITSVLKDVILEDDTYYQFAGDTAIIKNLGVSGEDSISNNWIINSAINFAASSVEIVNFDNRIYKVNTNINHNLRVYDYINITSNDGVSYDAQVTSISSEKVFTIQVNGTLDITFTYSISRKINKVSNSNYVGLSSEVSDIQNVYKDGNKILVASSSIPNYNTTLSSSDRSVSFDANILATSENPVEIFTIGNHTFYTGDLIYYTPGTVSLFEEGLYFIKRESNTTVRFAKSRANIYRSIFEKVSTNIQNSNNNLVVDYNIHRKTLQSQKLLREIDTPINNGVEYDTEPGSTGIFINGVELLNYKSRDKIYYGPIEKIDVLDNGLQYDIINPPILNISDSVGSGATGYCSVKGSLQQIRIIDPGFDYIETPKIVISGGNGTGAKASASMKLIDHKVLFNSESKFALVNLSNNTIAFSTYHKFRNAERVIYNPEGQTSIGGLSTNSSYYVSVQNSQTIKLHKTFDDAVSGINTISLTSYGVGNHILESFNKKSVVASINVEDSGINYENKKRTADPTDVSTSLGYINIKNHGFESKEIVRYTTTGTVIGGLSSNTNYYVTKIDNDNFKLSEVNSNSTDEDFYYRTKQYVQITSVGSGIHIFNYPQISVNIIGGVGISSIGSNTFEAVVQPIFRGEITSVHLENGGIGYGSSEILNFEREPVVTLNSGSGCKLVPIINDGKIVQVLVDNKGSGYNSPPNINIFNNGSGVGAVLTPVIENGQVVSVKIVESGAGYDKNKTSITVTSSGSAAVFKTNIKSWNVNLFKKYFNTITDDDGFITYNPNSNYQLQYCHLYSPRKLRENVYSREIGGKVLYGKFDLRFSNSVETSSDDHSPIIGWAYDGNPIYGPYGYSKKDGGQITQMKSGYVENLQSNRPPFPVGFFVEDYEYREVDDDTVLDEYNGRFCVTPDFPNGTYAYFTSIESSADSSAFGGYRLPKFPYVIGNKFKSSPNSFNFSRSSNQDEIDLSEKNWKRNTFLYNLASDENSYKYVSLPNKLNQTVDIKYSSPGSIEEVKINFSGSDYKVNDKVVFDDNGTGGYGFSSKVSRINGKSVNNISVASSIVYDNEIYSVDNARGVYAIQSEFPYNFSNGEIINISGLSTSNFIAEGFYSVAGIITNTFAISNPNGIGSVSSTGIVTYVSVSGNIAYSNIQENDLFVIGNEKVKILNVDPKSSRIRILRAIDGTVGTSHSYSDIFYELPRRFTVRSGVSTSFDYKLNREIYFNPKESLGIGTISGVGIGTTIFFSNPGVGITQIFIPTRSIYLPNHKLETGDSLTYLTNGGSEIIVSRTGIGTTTLFNQSTLFVAKISDDLIGLSTVKVGVGSTGTFVGIASTTSSISTLYFVGVGTGVYHSFKTNYQKVTGEISKNIVTVSTASSHGLSDGDEVFVKVNSGVSTTVIVTYDDFNRKLLLNPRTFVSGDVDSSNNTITVLNHNFEIGQKISFASTQSSGELVNNKIYYVVPYNKDKIRLATSYYDATKLVPQTIGIGSTSVGTISPINPPIKGYKNSSIIFDVSDQSLSYLSGLTRYSAFKLNFYLDSNFTQIFDTSETSSVFEVQRTGKVGIDTNATVSLKINDSIPEKLFYKLDLIYDANLPIEKSEINIDDTVFSNNQINILPSSYNGSYRITSTSSTTFTYSIGTLPEVSSYNLTNSTLSYETTSNSAVGGISKVDILSKGQNYYSLPSFVNVSSDAGTGSILEATSTSIGKIQKTKINDIGFDFPSDSTLKPNLSLPQIIKLETLASIDSIGITSVGRGYTAPAKLIVIDGKTNQVFSDIDLRYSLGDTQVQILKNTFSLSNTEPTIIPTQNSNGVGIGSIFYNSTTKDVTVRLSVGFSTSDDFPFSVGDKVLIENVSVGAATTAVGFNSRNYNYQLFTIKSVDPNIGGIGTVSYSLDGYLNEGEIVGTFDPELSSGRIIPQKYFPTFKITLKGNDFYIGESVRYLDQKNPIGVVEGWDKKNNQLRISSKETIQSDKIIKGISSGTEGDIFSTLNFISFVNTGAYTKYQRGWETNTGFLNDNLQRLQDNFYYQNFSYSLRSRVPYDKWEDAVGSLNHTAGFKKFSDYQLESEKYCGINTDAISNLDASVDLYSPINLNCVYDFDLVRENSLIVGNDYFSDEITFKNKILADYFELISNTVLSIDDISSNFNNDFNFEVFAEVDRFRISEYNAKKYIFCIKDRRYTSERQIIIVTLLQDGSRAYLNQYAKIETYVDLGSFDFRIEGDEGVLLFYPTKNRVNDYDITHISYNLENGFSGIGTITSLGDIVDIITNTTYAPTQTEIISLDSNKYTSSKILVKIVSDNNEYQYDELNLVYNNGDVYLSEYGRLLSGSSQYYVGSGFGTYDAYLSGSDIKVDFIPNPSISATVTTVQVALANTSYTGIGSTALNYAGISAQLTNIPASISPIPRAVSEYPSGYYGSYHIAQISDITNNRVHFAEIVALDDDLGNIYTIQYGDVKTNPGSDLGSFEVTRSGNKTSLMFTPIPNVEIETKIYSNFITDTTDDSNKSFTFADETISTNVAIFYGIENEINQSFELYHKNNPIFKNIFNGQDSSIVNLTQNTITIPNHFFVTGEKVSYSYGSALLGNDPISIDDVDFGPGIGVTNKIPSTVYVIKVDQNTIRLAKNAQDALSDISVPLNFTNVGVGASHSFISVNQNAKCLIAIDNIIQSPIVSTAITSKLSKQFSISEDILYVDNEKLFYTGDFVKIDDEIVRIRTVGVGSTNALYVKRSAFGTNIVGHSTDSIVRKVSGSYNIIDNIIHFGSAPYGLIPISSPNNTPDERDWVGISTRSIFQGRVFLRSGVSNSSEETYLKNYVFDDISNQFNGDNKSFTLTSNTNSTLGISTENAIVLINDIFQEPGETRNYTLSQTISGITSITFVGTATSTLSDINTSGLPRGGIIVSVGSTEGFGYQPLVAAGATATVSIAGTISAISIGNSGSGYRSAVQTPDGIKNITVRVGVATSSVETPNIEFIGTATVSNGNIVSIAITNPGTGYTATNPPYVIIDSPISYSSIPLIHSSPSLGIGVQATIDIVVGQGSSVIDFEIKNLGYNYSVGDTLTIPVGGAVGIPTITGPSFKPFQVSVQQIFSDKFNGWSIGELQSFDKIERFFNGQRTIFPISYQGTSVSLYVKKGYPLSIQDTLLVFMNDILQVPGESYIFNGGNKIEFTEAPKEGDTCKIIFYKGSGEGIDVEFVDAFDTVKIGDELTLTYDSSLGQSSSLLENARTVSDIDPSTAQTNPYFGPGNTQDTTLYRPVNWCRQTEDKIINEQYVGKDRVLYEPSINPSAYLIKSVGIGSTIVYVDNLRPFFDPKNESQTSLEFQKNITLISKETLVSASATAIVSAAGTISSIVINDGGFGYESAPTVSIQSPTGITTITTTAVSSISAGIVTSISITGVVSGYSQQNLPSVLIDPPSAKVETNKINYYEGDSGIIVGLGTTSSSSYNQIIMDLYIPSDSYLKDPNIVGVPIVQSSLSEGDFFIVYGSNVGIGTTLTVSVGLDGSSIGVSTQYIDNVYQVSKAETLVVNVTGVGSAFVRRVFSRIVGLGTVNFASENITFDSNLYKFDNTSASYAGTISTSNYFGNYSWGKIGLKSRSKQLIFNSDPGIGGSITSLTEVRRLSPLKYTNYII